MLKTSNILKWPYMDKWQRPQAAMFFNKIKFFKKFERQSIEKYFCDNKIEIHQPV